MISDQQIKAILDRNARVEAEKAWEVSMTRRGAIALITYATACFFLWLIGNENFPVNALVPTGGYVLSTLTLPPLKRLWMKNMEKR